MTAHQHRKPPRWAYLMWWALPVLGGSSLGRRRGWLIGLIGFALYAVLPLGQMAVRTRRLYDLEHTHPVAALVVAAGFCAVYLGSVFALLSSASLLVCAGLGVCLGALTGSIGYLFTARQRHTLG